MIFDDSPMIANEPLPVLMLVSESKFRLCEFDDDDIAAHSGLFIEI